MGHNMIMATHIKCTIKKAEKLAATLSRNLSGPKTGNRKLIGSVINSTILYGAPVSKELIEKKKYKQLIEGVQRKIALRISIAYRRVSTKAIQVVAGFIPIHLLIQERSYEKHSYNRSRK